MKRTFVYSLKLDSVGLSVPSQRDDENFLPICMGQRTTEKSIINIALSESESVTLSVASDSWQPHGLEPARLLCPWNFPDKNTEVSLPFPSKGNLPNPGIEPRSPVLQASRW